MLRILKKASVKSTSRNFTILLDKDYEIRDEKLFGKEYTVVNVVAMVEGVRFGQNQQDPELGLASEFGNNPISWANRPITLNHPKEDDTYVSANSPKILESYCFGFTMNPVVEDSKLKLEAWIDKDRVQELGGDFQEVYDRIIDQESEEVVEISVGFFSDVEAQKGKFKGQAYSGIWRNIRPDHLAILPFQKGACSVEDGCGIPRINEENDMADKPEIKVDSEEAIETVECNCEAECTCEGKEPKALKKSSKTSVPKVNSTKSLNTQKAEDAIEAHQSNRALNKVLVDQQIDPSLLSSDVMKLLSKAAKDEFGPYTYVYGYTNDYMIFEQLNTEDYVYEMFKINVNIENDSVEFMGEKQKVMLMTRIVEQSEAKPTVLKERKMENNPKSEPKVLTAEEYINQAPEGLREVLDKAFKTHEGSKAEAVTAILALESNKFTEDYLKTKTLEELDGILAIANPSFNGKVMPTPPRIIDQESNFVAAPKVFGKPIKADSIETSKLA